LRALPENGEGCGVTGGADDNLMVPAVTPPAVSAAHPPRGVLGYCIWLLGKVNTVAAVISAIAIAAAGCVLTWEAMVHYLLSRRWIAAYLPQMSSEWQDEVTILLLVGATFLSLAWIQERRGHIGIQALEAVLPAAADRARHYLSDIVTLLFCGFFCWKSWTRLIEALNEGQTSNSALGEPMWIVYGSMALGMTLLLLVLIAQVLSRDALRRKTQGAHH
jgi:TRAP-type C4-dicarboxylate transport system permease small subunit